MFLIEWASATIGHRGVAHRRRKTQHTNKRRCMATGCASNPSSRGDGMQSEVRIEHAKLQRMRVVTVALSSNAR
jgi:hypothetical protein